MPYKYANIGLKIAIPVLLAAISMLILAKCLPTASFTESVVTSVDTDKDTVLRLAGSSTAVSVALTALPGDFATPIAEQLAEMSSSFLLVLCALYLEKFLTVVVGKVVFGWMIPLACMVYMVGLLREKNSLKETAYKITVFSLVLVLVVPASTSISGMIRERYGDTIEQTIESAEASASLIQDSIDTENEDENKGNGLGNVLKNLQDAGDTIAKGSSEMVRYLESLTNKFIEAVAIMIVTSCVIPVLVILIFLWLTKIIFMVDYQFDISKFPIKLPGKKTKL